MNGLRAAARLVSGRMALVLSVGVVTAAGASVAQGGFQTLSGPYLGQAPPGQTPTPFADGLVANAQRSFHSNVVFASGGAEAYWPRRESDAARPVIVKSRLREGRRTAPETASFSLASQGDDAPFVSPDGRTLFFISKRPLASGAKGGKENIWVVERTVDDWSAPRPLPDVVNGVQGIHWQLSVDRAGHLYFGSCADLHAQGRQGDIYCARYAGGRYTAPARLGDVINSKGYNHSPFIAPDGSYLIFAREDAETHSSRILVSYREADGGWGPPQETSPYIGNAEQNGPVVTGDGKYLFFLRYVRSFGQPFWVDAGFLAALRPRPR